MRISGLYRAYGDEHLEISREVGETGAIKMGIYSPGDRIAVALPTNVTGPPLARQRDGRQRRNCANLQISSGWPLPASSIAFISGSPSQTMAKPLCSSQAVRENPFADDPSFCQAASKGRQVRVSLLWSWDCLPVILVIVLELQRPS